MTSSHAIKMFPIVCALLLTVTSLPLAAQTSQKNLPMSVNIHGKKQLKFDWPILKIGTASYEDGPTGVTVFQFTERPLVAVDVRGGATGTVNTPFLENMYNLPELDAIVFSGGSLYGLEATTAVMTALKDDGIRDGNVFTAKPNIAMAYGAIIYDFGSRRLNEIYPDKRLSQAALRSAKTGSFPLGAYGAGRMTRSGGFFGCDAASGQGGAFMQKGQLKIAAFSVVNPYGAVVDRDGKVAACHKGKEWPDTLYIKDLWKDFPESRKADWPGHQAKNTTISLIVVNQKLAPVVLKRLAVQVHSAMARSIQPFATMYDGDVLYAVSTAEIEDKTLDPIDLGSMAAEVMWDAVLSSVPVQQQHAIPDHKQTFTSKQLNAFTGTYRFSDFASVQVTRKGKSLFAKAVGGREVFSIKTDTDTQLHAVSGDTFMVKSRLPLTFKFSGEQLILNPGQWQQTGKKQ